MNDWIMPPAAPVSLAVQDSASRFPVRRVFCVGRNYWWDAAVDGQRPPREAPFFFMKPADAVVAAAGIMPFPPLTAEFCHEIELVVAIGRDGRNIAAEAALGHVWGYAAGLDLTRRDQQQLAKEYGRPWEGAKAFDASAPCGALAPASVIGHPRHGKVWLDVNGAPRQRTDLAELIWPVADIVSFISASVTLRAGDLIFTGTPTGVGPLQPGDVVDAGIDGVGRLSMTVGARPEA